MGDRADLQFQTGRLILVFGDIRLTPGVGQHAMGLPFTHSASWLMGDTAACSVMLSARVYSTNVGMKWVGEVSGRVFTTRAYEVSDELVLGLSDSQLVALDAERQDDRLQLIVNLAGTLIHVPPDVPPNVETQLPLSVSRETWLRSLDQIGKEVGILIRVPSPLTDKGGGVPLAAGDPAIASKAQATARLRQARTEISDGQYENSVATCRLVLDSLGLLAPLPGARAVFAKVTSTRTQAERWAAVQHDLHSLLSGAHHDDSLTRGFTWDRSDAEAVLAMVSCLVMRTFRAE